MSQQTSCAIAVMAKAPQPGRSKTRLVPALTPDQAAALSAAFLRDVTENIQAAAKTTAITGYIAYAPAGLEHLFAGHLAPATQLILADGAPDMPPGVENFGGCLLHAIQTLLASGHGSACVLNSDSPTLPTTLLARTANLLAAPGDRAVLGPADDGGYYILGMKQAHAHLFADIAWSTHTVARDTAKRAAEIGLELITLPTWYDVDDAASLARLIENLQCPPDETPTPYDAPATRACLDSMGLLTAHAIAKRA
jgi:rSAM/selenodomain-associated transferase 1